MITKTPINCTVEHHSDTNSVRIDLVEFENRVYSQVNAPDGAATLIINDNREILLINSVRPAVGEISWEIPRGGIDEGELPVEAAARELQEETGFVVNAQHLLPLGYMNPDSGILSTKLYLFLHKTSQKPSAMSYIADGIEAKDIRWVNLIKVVEAIVANDITDSATIATLGKAKLMGII